MEYIKALIIKFIMITAVLWVVLELFGTVTFADVLITSVLLTGVSFIGDVYILPKIGNVAATIADFGLALIMIWALGSFLFEQPIALGTASLISAAIIAVGEAFFHHYMMNQVIDDDKPLDQTRNIHQRNNLQTEFGTDTDIKSEVEKEKIRDK